MASHRHAHSWLMLLVSVLLLSACGGDDDGAGPAPTATNRPGSTVTATGTAVSTATAIPSTPTSAPPTTTATSVPATSTPLATDTAAPSPTETVPPAPTETPLQVGVTALFHTDATDPANPFPTDRLLDATGHVNVTGAIIGGDLPADPKYDPARNAAVITAPQFSRLTGFSTYAPVRVKFAGQVVVPAEGGGAFLVDCDRGAAEVRVEATTIETSGDFALEIYPVVPLLPKTTYVYVVTRDVLDTEGKNVSPSAEFTQALQGEVEGLTAWRAELDCALEQLAEESGIGAADIAVADVFTTQAITDELLAITNLFVDGTLPTASPVFEDSPLTQLDTGIFDEGTPGFEAVLGSATSDTIARVAVGSFPSHDFRTAGVFDSELIGGNGTPRINNLEFYMSIPKAPAPEGGYPLVIFGHGLGGSARNAVDIASLFDGAPLATIGISAVQHGLRGNVAQFFNLTNGFATRDNFRQTVADTIQLRRMIGAASGAPFDVINKDRVHYMGISLGGIMGTLFMGYEPEVQVGMLSVPGGGLPNILRSEAIGQLLQPLIALTFQIQLDDPNFPAFLHRFGHLAQWSLDAGDPINTAPVILDADRVLPGVPLKRVLMHEGVVDNVVPNATTDALALAMGLPDANQTSGCLLASGCSGIWRFVMSDYGFDPNSGHGVTAQVPQAAAQATQYLLSDGTQIINATP